VAPTRITGRILREIWWGLDGAAVSDLTNHPRFKQGPDTIDYLPALDSSSLGKDYGVRIRGYLHPPADGNYRFWIASDDSSELWLSTDEDAQNKRYLAGVSGWTPRLGWDQDGGQVSASIALEQDKRYYIEILHKQADQKDSLSIAWQIPGHERAVIDGLHLSPIVRP
jgi:xyloglucan-specific exo-beta-1,4-glucanase